MNNQQSKESKGKDKRICRHPCFHNYDFHSAVMHLPIAGVSNVTFQENLFGQLPFRKDHKDSEMAMDLNEALLQIQVVRKSLPNLSVIAIAGPKEPLADFETLKSALRFIKQTHPEMNLCIQTNGLLLPVYGNHLISLGVNSISITLYTLNPATGAKIFQNISYMGRVYSGIEGANILIQNQMAGIHFMTSHQIAVRITIPVIEGINEHEVEEMVFFAKALDSAIVNIISANHPEKESGLEAYQSDGLEKIREEAEKIMPLSYFCKSCKAQSVESLTTIFQRNLKSFGEASLSNIKENQAIRFAVCSKNGTLTDQHFGLTTNLYIYEYLKGKITFLELRRIRSSEGDNVDSAHKKEGRIYYLIRAIEDCNCVICVRMGSCAQNALKEKQIDTYMTYNLIEDGIKEAVHHLYQGRRYV